MTPDIAALARSILASQAFSSKLGTELVAFEPGHAELALAIEGDLRQQHGYVHGGVLAYLADVGLAFAGGSVLGDSVTVELKINYVRPARGEGRLLAVADVVGHGSSQAVVRCDVFVVAPTGERELCAAAQGTIRKAK